MLCQAIRPSVMTFKGVVPLIVTVKNIILKWKWNQSIFKRKPYPLEEGCPWTEHVFRRLVPLIATVESRILKSKWNQQKILKENPRLEFWVFSSPTCWRKAVLFFLDETCFETASSFNVMVKSRSVCWNAVRRMTVLLCKLDYISHCAIAVLHWSASNLMWCF